ncbi:MAG: helix-turn-helix transcriptional regulator [Rhodospirillales bacterium]|nr:helix-turn-helix transcriptional regulator [Rhodospirillales bacterium]
MRQGRPVGEILRDWRQRRRLSQLDLACEADISTKHLSFLETGRSRPSREMLLHLAERLEVPLRDRNLLLAAAGFTPEYPERALDDPALESARRGVEALLAAHEPNPALAVDRHWHLVAGNAAVGRLIADVEPTLLRPPVNVLRLSLHPAGLAPRVVNLPEWRAHVVQRLRRQIDVSGDPVLHDLLEELLDYPVPGGPTRAPSGEVVAVPFRLATSEGTLSFFSTTTVFGTPVEVTLSELAIEAFFPADAETARLMRQMAAAAADPREAGLSLSGAAPAAAD